MPPKANIQLSEYTLSCWGFNFEDTGAYPTARMIQDYQPIGIIPQRKEEPLFRSLIQAYSVPLIAYLS